MTITQKKVIRELLKMSTEHGFGGGYPLLPIAEKLGITEPLYDNNTNTGILWEFGPHGNGMINASGDWPKSYASISYDTAQQLEHWSHPQSDPKG